MAASIKGDGSVSWGSGGAGVSSGGYLQSASVKKTTEEATVENESGETAALALYNESYEITASFVVKSGNAGPEIGAAFSVGGLSGYVTAVERNWENKAFSKYTVTAKGYAALGSAS